MSKLSPQELIDELENFVNGASDEKLNEFVNAFNGMHRTLQQKAFGMMLKVVENVASSDYHFDGRNEESHKRAQLILNGFNEAQITQLMNEDSYWTKEKATDFVTKHFKFSSLPIV